MNDFKKKLFSVLNIFMIFDVFYDPWNVVFDFGENLKIEINFFTKMLFCFDLERVF